MDATRTRRTRDRARQGWYARYRQWRFARYLGFADGAEAVLAALAACRPSLADGTSLHLCPAPVAIDLEPTSPALAQPSGLLAMSVA